MGNYNDVLLEQLADQGDGFYAYVNGIDEAKALFRDRLTSTLQTVALDAKAQVEFDPRAVDAYRLVGYEDRAVAGRVLHRSAGGRRRDRRRPCGDGALRRPAGARTARGRDPFATIRLRWTDPDPARPSACPGTIRGERPRRLVRGDRSALPARRHRGRASAEVLRDSPYADRLGLRGHPATSADRDARTCRGPDQVHEFLDLLDAMRRIVD